MAKKLIKKKSSILDNITLDNISDLDSIKQMLDIKENLLIEKGLQSDDPHEILKAANAIKIKRNSVESEEDHKAVFVDPFYDPLVRGDYKIRASQISADTLIAMSRAPVINSIVKTRQQQVANFSQPQMDEFSTGFVIKKKKRFSERNNDKEYTKDEWKRIDFLTEMVMECGVGTSWSRDSFETFLRKGVTDSLVLDQWNWEIVRNKLGQPFEVLAVDSATIAISDTYDDYEAFKKYGENSDKQIGGYFPSYVQVIRENIAATFYPWELAFCVRNPSSRIRANGYGRSELEDMINIVTSMFWSDEYNRNFFKNGSSPKGILKMKKSGGQTGLESVISKVNQKAIREFKQAWRAMALGVGNAWNIPVLESDMDWIDLQKSNRDMEFNQWINYLVRLACALYTISPAEIGFSFENEAGGLISSRESGSKNDSMIKYSKDKGLKPLLRSIQYNINKYWISQVDPEYYLEFTGLEAEDEKERRERQASEVQNWKTINEVRKENNRKEIEGGDIIMNSIFTGNMMQQQMMQQQGGMMGDGEDERMMGDEGEGQEGSQIPNDFGDVQDQEEENPMFKAFKEYTELHLT